MRKEQRAPGFTPGASDLRFPQRSLSSIAEAGFTPAEALDDSKGEARTPMTLSPKGAGGCVRERYPPDFV